MMKVDPEALYYIFWALGIFGALMLLMVLVDLIRFFWFGQLIIWWREVLVVILAFLCIYISNNRLNNLE